MIAVAALHPEKGSSRRSQGVGRSSAARISTKPSRAALTGCHASYHVAVEHDLSGSVTRREQSQHNPHVFDRLSRLVVHSGAQFTELVGWSRRPVPHVHGGAYGQQATRHGGAHRAGPDDGDSYVGHVVTMSTDRRDDRPDRRRPGTSLLCRGGGPRERSPVGGQHLCRPLRGRDGTVAGTSASGHVGATKAGARWKVMAVPPSGGSRAT